MNCEIKIAENPEKHIDYRARLERSNGALTLTQYSNGTLLIRGRTEPFFEHCCDLIEEIAKPAENGVIQRFISMHERILEEFNKIYTPELIKLSEETVKKKLGVVYDYLDSYQQK